MTDGAEVWVLNKNVKKKIQVTEMDFWEGVVESNKQTELQNKQIMGIENDIENWIRWANTTDMVRPRT